MAFDPNSPVPGASGSSDLGGGSGDGERSPDPTTESADPFSRGDGQAAKGEEQRAPATSAENAEREDDVILVAEAALVDEADAGFGDAGVPDPDEDIFAPSSDVDPRIAELEKERDDWKDALVRLQADFENYKKRVVKQQAEQADRATEALIERLLPVLDTVDLALAHGGGEEIKQVTSALSGALEKEGLERIDPTGGPFDPTLHDAVAHEPGDGGEHEVAEVLRAGYRWKGRVIRAAMVRVRG